MLRPKPLPSPDRAFLQALLIRLGYWKGARVNRKHLEDERYTDPKEGKRKPVFEDPDNDFKWSSGRPLPGRVQNAVAIAGGFSARAQQKNVDITRHVNGKVITGRVPITDPIMPGDTIFARERLF